MTITPLYAALLAFLFVFLSVRTIRLRIKHKIGVGDGGNSYLLRAMRVHANFSEYVPLSLLLIFFVEHSGAASYLIHTLGAALVFSRCLHAYGVSQVREQLKLRTTAILINFAIILVSAGLLIYLQLLNTFL